MDIRRGNTRMRSLSILPDELAGRPGQRDGREVHGPRADRGLHQEVRQDAQHASGLRHNE